ncbi:guanine nucleotide-binding protein subunit alpha-11-like isoform X5 [Periplaneta americana]|uniref:guanine nucleotide-binding protein subunit alpha-11-like isoform X5 n=1 Tax=Periplaneta americana TaxID=6978 RepID=UPI0037E8D9BA
MTMDMMCLCCQSQEARESNRISNEIDRILIEEMKNRRKQIKIILFGSEESGKSTFIKQMKIIYGAGFPENERRNFVQVVHHNLCVSMQTMIKAMRRLRIPYTIPSNEEKARLFLEEEFIYFSAPTSEHIQICKTLWEDPGTRECFRRRQEFCITESASYYLPKIDLVTTPGYLPTEQDILYARVPTSGINEYSFNVEKAFFRIVELGSQRLRRKWFFDFFENVECVIFITAISEYDQYLYEGGIKTRLMESMELFQMTVVNPWFRRSSFVLFLNKTDVLKEKISYSDLAVHFPDFKGPTQDADAAQRFIQDMFHCMNPDRQKVVYTYHTCATGKN